MRSVIPERVTKPIRQTLNTSGFAFPKPVPREKSQPKDGRRIESPREYSRTKQAMLQHQHGMCAKPGCSNYMPTAAHGHRHHPGGRGLGGGKRDDSKTVLWCWSCHDKEHEKLRKGKR